MRNISAKHTHAPVYVVLVALVHFFFSSSHSSEPTQTNIAHTHTYMPPFIRARMRVRTNTQIHTHGAIEKLSAQLYVSGARFLENIKVVRIIFFT